MINGDPIFTESVLRPVDADLKRIARLAHDVSEFKAAARDIIGKQINIMISDTLITKAAKETLSEDDTKRVDAYMNKLTKDLLTKYEGSAARADQDLRAQGSSMDKELADKRRKTIIDLYLHKTLWPKIVVTRKQIMEDYERNIKKYTIPAEVDLYTITLPVTRFLPKQEGPNGASLPLRNPTDAQWQEAQNLALARARDLIAELKKGGDFATMAEANSVDPKSKNGGRWPHTRQGMLAITQIEKAAFALPSGGLAEPVLALNPDDQTRSVIVIVKVGDVTPTRVIGFEEAQEGIERKLRETQYVTLTNEYYQRLREKAAVEGVDRMVETVVDASVVQYLGK
jgi:hypothetical protein